MTNKKLYCEDVLQMLFADYDSEWEYLRFGNDDLTSNDRASLGTSLLRNGAAGYGESVHKAQTSENFGPLPNGDGVAGLDVVLVSIGEALRCWWSPPDCIFFLIVHAQSAAGRQYRCSQCWVTLGLCSVPYDERYHTLKNYKRSPRYLIGQISGQLIKK